MNATQRRSFDDFLASQRRRLDRNLDRCVQRAQTRKAALARSIDNAQPRHDDENDDVSSPDAALDHVATEEEPVEEQAPHFDHFVHRTGVSTMGQNANTINRPGPAAQYPSRPNTNVPPPRPAAINGVTTPRS